MTRSQLIMNFTTPPSAEDLIILGQNIVEVLPPDLLDECDDLAITVEELADDAMLEEADVSDPYELPALYRSGKEISPGVMSKVANSNDVLVLFRKPILEMWCDSEDHLFPLLRDVIIQELGQAFELTEQEMMQFQDDHYQEML